MSQLLVLPSLELLLIAGRAIALVLGLLIFAWAFRHWRRAASRDTQRVFEQLDLVRSELLIMKEVMHHSHRGDQSAANHGSSGYGRMSHGVSGHGSSGHSASGHGSQYQGSLNHGSLTQGSDSHGMQATSPSTQRLLTTPSGTARGYEIAARMARNGAGKDELIRSCGITGHEAELLVKLHGQRRAGAAELLGKQPRVAESAQEQGLAGAPRQTQANNSLQPTRQAPAGQRQQPAATTQRATERTGKAPALPQRSRLVAVG